MMFTLEQIRKAHSRVKTGADFPAYIQEIKNLGVESYEHFVNDGHINYYGYVDFKLSAPPKWEVVTVAPKAQKERLKQEIKIHQKGKTDYLTFCKIAADAGVEKWIVDIRNMMCTYYGLAGDQMVAEPIPDARSYTH